MTEVYEILKYVIPSIITFLASFLVLKKFIEIDQRKQFIELKTEQRKETLAARMLAYERLILFLERISPSSIIPRVHTGNATASQLRSDLIATVRSEFEHNLSQQLYVSNETWVQIKQAKEETIKMINIAYSKCIDKSGTDLAKVIYEIILGIEKSPSDKAIDYIKKEFIKKFSV